MTAPSDPALESFFRDIGDCRDKNNLTHGLHPYPAKFIPHIPRKLIETFASYSLPVLDPMCGSGTTLVEAALQGHRSIGIDLNPIATLAARAKTSILSDDLAADLELFARQLRKDSHDAVRLCASAEPREFLNRDKWLLPQVAQEIFYALERVRDLDVSGQLLATAAISSLIVSVSNQESETRWCAKPNPQPDGEVLRRLAAKLEGVVAAARKYTSTARGSVEVLRADARSLPLAESSVGTIVTSPPYANSHDYYLYHKLRLFVLGFEVAPVQFAEIGSRNRHSDMKAEIDHYIEAMSSAVAEWRRVLRSGGYAAVVVGDAVIRSKFYNMRDVFTAVASRSDFRLTQAYRFGHRQFNATFQRGFGTALEKVTHVLVFQ